MHLFTKGISSIEKNGIFKTIKKVIVFIFKRIKLSRFEIELYSYKCEYQENIDFSQYKSAINPIAFYLPQFHRIPENDEWWGNGFTEWANTRKAKPMFKGHYQPHEPHEDFGYYNLADVEVIKKQAKLAKQHGIYGFCFYLYWFSGKRLLEKPLDLFLEHQEININFCLCWANENWTRRWDGLENKVLMKQSYLKNDPIKFICDIKKYIVDKRYIRIDGIPIVLVYNPGCIPDINNVFEKWRKYAENTGIGKIKILICKTFGHTEETLDIENIVDGSVEFPPLNIPSLEVKNICFFRNNATIYNYKELVFKIQKNIIIKNEAPKKSKAPLYHTCMLGWDNTARKKYNYNAFAGFSQKSFFEWATLLVNESKKLPESIFFINAWNEWGEGTHLEPDKRYGYANINTLSKAIFNLPFE